MFRKLHVTLLLSLLCLGIAMPSWADIQIEYMMQPPWAGPLIFTIKDNNRISATYKYKGGSSGWTGSCGVCDGVIYETTYTPSPPGSNINGTIAMTGWWERGGQGWGQTYGQFENNFQKIYLPWAPGNSGYFIDDWFGTGVLQSKILTVTKAGSGAGTVSGATLYWAYNVGVASFTELTPSTVNLTANASSGSTFAGWSGEGCSGTGTCSVTMSASRNVTATFNAAPPPPQNNTLTVIKQGTGTGSVSDNYGILHWNGNQGSATYNANTQVTLTATTGANSTFTGWTGQCNSIYGNICSVTMDAAKTVYATFDTLPARTLTVTKQGSGAKNGIVTANPGTLSWDLNTNTGTASYNNNTIVTLTAKDSLRSKFSGWGGNWCNSTGNICYVTMDQSKSVTANFVKPCILTVVNSDNSTGTGTVLANGAALDPPPTGSDLVWPKTIGIKSYTCGAYVAIIPKPDKIPFGGWSGEGCSDTGYCYVKMDDDRTMWATFK